MTEYSTNTKVDFYFEKAEKCQEEFEMLRSVTLDCHLIEELN